MTRIGIIIPSRGSVDRKPFLDNALKMLASQTLQPVQIEVVNEPPKDDRCDITYRYRNGYNRFKESDVDLICFWEEDDWYAPDYLEYMVKKWQEFGNPDLFGINYTIYYHLKIRKYFTFRHDQRASAMSTFIKPNLSFTWPQDHDPYTDMWLWMNYCGLVNKIVFEPGKVICVGMKHGIGMSGGHFHQDRLHRFINDDNGFLRNTLDDESYNFYANICF